MWALGACGGTVTANGPKAELRVQPVLLQGAFACPVGLKAAFRFEGVGICTDGTVSLEQIPPETCADAGLPNCGVLEPVAGEPTLAEPEPELQRAPTPKPTLVSPTGLSTASCDAFDPAQLLAVSSDQNCDSDTPQTCPEGAHIDWVPGSPCAGCVADSPENRTCAWATACFEPFIQSIAHASGAKSCNRDRDCAAMTVTAGCGPSLSLALKRHIDEEIPMIASLYAEQNCSLCPDAPESSFDLPKIPARCVDGVCR